ncbi:hypothetical protein DFJ74DRAFT_57195 [Hyaloraphidium curvatum]|nr:hypothetical protein DFJ74DRAFT_57195 [Hyaloraphidium curvatum]
MRCQWHRRRDHLRFSPYQLSPNVCCSAHSSHRMRRTSTSSVRPVRSAGASSPAQPNHGRGVEFRISWRVDGALPKVGRDGRSGHVALEVRVCAEHHAPWTMAKATIALSAPGPMTGMPLSARKSARSTSVASGTGLFPSTISSPVRTCHFLRAYSCVANRLGLTTAAALTPDAEAASAKSCTRVSIVSRASQRSALDVPEARQQVDSVQEDLCPGTEGVGRPPPRRLGFVARTVQGAVALPRAAEHAAEEAGVRLEGAHRVPG